MAEAVINDIFKNFYSQQ